MALGPAADEASSSHRSRIAQRVNPLVSVVMAAHNESRYIETSLSSLLRQTYEPMEIVVVDDGSSDDTAALAGRFRGVRVLRLDAHPGAGAARNVGARSSMGEILVFLDADIIYSPEFIERLVQPLLEREDIRGTFTKEILVANSNKMWARAHMIGRGLPVDSHFHPGFPDEWENFRAVRRDDFFSVDGFDEIGYGEDVTLGRKLKALAEAAPGATCWHHEPETLGDIFLTARWFGRGERIRETPRPLVVYGTRSIPRALRMAWTHRMPSLLVYRIVWDVGILTGLWTRRRGSVAK